MASHIVFTVVILIITCISLSSCSYDGATTYSARVLNTSQEECPSDAQREMMIAEVKEDIHNTLLQIHSREYMQIYKLQILTNVVRIAGYKKWQASRLAWLEQNNGPMSFYNIAHMICRMKFLDQAAPISLKTTLTLCMTCM